MFYEAFLDELSKIAITIDMAKNPQTTPAPVTTAPPAPKVPVPAPAPAAAAARPGFLTRVGRMAKRYSGRSALLAGGLLGAGALIGRATKE